MEVPRSELLSLVTKMSVTPLPPLQIQQSCVHITSDAWVCWHCGTLGFGRGDRKCPEYGERSRIEVPICAQMCPVTTMPDVLSSRVQDVIQVLPALACLTVLHVLQRWAQVVLKHFAAAVRKRRAVISAPVFHASTMIVFARAAEDASNRRPSMPFLPPALLKRQQAVLSESLCPVCANPQ